MSATALDKDGFSPFMSSRSQVVRSWPCPQKKKRPFLRYVALGPAVCGLCGVIWLKDIKRIGNLAVLALFYHEHQRDAG